MSKKIRGPCILFVMLFLTLFSTAQIFSAEDPELKKNVLASQDAIEKWLSVVDRGQYGESWDIASPRLKFTIPRAEWIRTVENWRKPLGPFVSRELVDARMATDPPNMPSGDYMVFGYKSTFRNRNNVGELVITAQSPDGVWRVLSYIKK
jgi:hypothetical protein